MIDIGMGVVVVVNVLLFCYSNVCFLYQLNQEKKRLTENVMMRELERTMEKEDKNCEDE